MVIEIPPAALRSTSGPENTVDRLVHAGRFAFDFDFMQRTYCCNTFDELDPRVEGRVGIQLGFDVVRAPLAHALVKDLLTIQRLLAVELLR